MANPGVSVAWFSDSEDSNQSPAAALGFINGGAAPSTSNFIGQEGAAYFGELEEVLMQGIVGGGIISHVGGRKELLGNRPPTLDIFLSWPGRRIQQPGEESTDSGSAQNTISQPESDSPESRKALSDQFGEQKQQQQLKAQSKRSAVEKDGKPLDGKTLRRLAQNREAARKSRLRKKAYVQQLENSRIKLTQIEHDLQRARSQGMFAGGGGGGAGGNISSGAAVFDLEYKRWVEESHRHMVELQEAALQQNHLGDGDLLAIVDDTLLRYDEFFRLRAVAAATDVFHLITGMWTSPAERCFLWMGGFRPSELIKILMPQLDPLTEQQAAEVVGLQRSSLQMEEALSLGLEHLRESVADAVAGASLFGCGDSAGGADNYMMAAALAKLSGLEGFVRQADNLRQQTLHCMRRILTVRQAARWFLGMEEHYYRLRALSSLWDSRPPPPPPPPPPPQKKMVGIESCSSCPSPPPSELQIIHQPLMLPTRFSILN